MRSPEPELQPSKWSVVPKICLRCPGGQKIQFIENWNFLFPNMQIDKPSSAVSCKLSVCPKNYDSLDAAKAENRSTVNNRIFISSLSSLTGERALLFPSVISAKRLSSRLHLHDVAKWAKLLIKTLNHSFDSFMGSKLTKTNDLLINAEVYAKLSMRIAIFISHSEGENCSATVRRDVFHFPGNTYVQEH